MKETIIFEDCDNGIYLNSHTETSEEIKELVCVFKNEEKNEAVGRFILADVMYVLEEEDCNKAKITITIEPIKD